MAKMVLFDASTPVDADVRAAIVAALAPYRDAAGVADVAVGPDEDHDGDPVIRVWLDHHLADPEAAFPEIRALDNAVRDSVWATGEQRFVHIRHVFNKRLADA